MSIETDLLLRDDCQFGRAVLYQVYLCSTMLLLCCTIHILWYTVSIVNFYIAYLTKT